VAPNGIPPATPPGAPHGISSNGGGDRAAPPGIFLAAPLAPAGIACQRVAVVDFDVHHGDGTEEIVRHLSASLPPGSLFFASIHLYDPGDAHISAFYPSSGGR